MFWHINIYFKSDLFEIRSFIFFFVLTCAIYVNININPNLNLENLAFNQNQDLTSDQFDPEYFTSNTFAEYWIHFAACLATFSLIFKNTEKSRINLWAVTCCLE